MADMENSRLMTAFNSTAQVHHSERWQMYVTHEERSSGSLRDVVPASQVRAKVSVASDQITPAAEAPSSVLRPALILFSS